LRGKQIPLCVPRPPKCGGEEKARDFVRDDSHFKNRVENRVKRNVKPNVKDVRLKSRRSLPIQKQKQNLPGSMNLNRPLHGQTFSCVHFCA
jgi:hypothetical protein